MSTNLSTRCRLPPNHRPLFMSLSLSSALVTVIFLLAFYLSSSVRMSLIAVGESSNMRVHASLIWSGPASISASIFSIPFGWRLYLSRSTPSTLSYCHPWSPVTSMMSESHFLAARSSSSRCSRSSMLLVAVGLVSLLKFPFLLYDNR